MWGKEYDRSLQLLFPAPSGEPFAPNSLTKMIVRLMAKAGIARGVQPVHGFRHASATSLLSAGHNAVAVSKRLGHSKVSTTLNVYGHATSGKTVPLPIISAPGLLPSAGRKSERNGA